MLIIGHAIQWLDVVYFIHVLDVIFYPREMIYVHNYFFDQRIRMLIYSYLWKNWERQVFQTQIEKLKCLLCSHIVQAIKYYLVYSGLVSCYLYLWILSPIIAFQPPCIWIQQICIYLLYKLYLHLLRTQRILFQKVVWPHWRFWAIMYGFVRTWNFFPGWRQLET